MRGQAAFFPTEIDEPEEPRYTREEVEMRGRLFKRMVEDRKNGTFPKDWMGWWFIRQLDDSTGEAA